MSDLNAPLRVVIADDQRAVREALAVMLDLIDGIEVVGTAADGRQTLELVATLSPAVVLLDLHMPMLDGVETTRAIVREHPGVAVVVLTSYVDDGSVHDAVSAGATGYLSKNAGRSDIARALEAAVHGQSVLSGDALATLMRRLVRPLPHASPATPLPVGLTQREAELLILIARGHTNTEIAQTLHLSPHTVKTHISHIFAKTGSRDRAQAVLFAREHNLAGAHRPGTQDPAH